MSRLIHVAAAVIRRNDGAILIARRPEHLHQGGLWEFPGGKVEAGETLPQALARELQEELGIQIDLHSPENEPLIQVLHDYGDKRVFLDVWLVTAFSGEAHGREGQPVRWVMPDQLSSFAFPAANTPIVQAARLPDRYLITGDYASIEDFQRRVETALAQGIRLIQLRAPQANEADLSSLAAVLRPLCRQWQASWLLNGKPELALRLEANGVHLNGQRLRALQKRPLGHDFWVAASCHNADELALAQQLELDFAVLSPVLPTQSHPGQATLGWAGFAELVQPAKLPVYALGGLEGDQVKLARSKGAQGVAAIRTWWQDRESRA